MVARPPIRLPYRELPGAISRDQLAEHHTLYLGYHDALRILDRDSPTQSTRGLNRGLKEAERFLIGGVLLHELFFLGLAEKPTLKPATTSIGQALQARWGSMDTWWDEMHTTALVARGWAITAVCEVDPSDIRVFMLDSHDVGGMVGYSPLVVLDVAEHAWWASFPNARESYLDALAPYVCWKELEKRWDQATGST